MAEEDEEKQLIGTEPTEKVFQEEERKQKQLELEKRQKQKE